MRKIRHSFLPGLMLTGLICLMFGVNQATQAAPQTGFLDRSWGDYTWGSYGGDREASRLGREELVARENYCTTKGCVLRLDRVEIQPSKCRCGQTVVLATTYTILTPDAVAIPVAISREISFQGKSLGTVKEMQSRKLNGTWCQEVNFTLPANAVPGVYTLKTKVSTGYALERKEVEFRVE